MAELDRMAILEAVLPALREAGDVAEDIPEALTARGVIRATAGGVVAGLPVVRETFARVGVRLRALREDGSSVEPDDPVAEVGGALRAILAAGETALGFLTRLSAVATASARGERIDPAGPLDGYAVEVGAAVAGGPAVGENHPSFALEVDD